jgi:hypothetical protein
MTTKQQEELVRYIFANNLKGLKTYVDENKIDLSKVYYKGRSMERSQGRKLNFL